jgi:subtilase family serine protease
VYEWVQAVLAATALPDVFSVSWGWSEADQCTIDTTGPCSAGGTAGSAAYVAAVNSQFALIGARGITVLISSGDSGAHGRTDPTCKTPKTRPDWPAASPYVTAVGATQIKDGTAITSPTTPICKSPPSGLAQCAGGGTEIVCSPATGALIASGGGFSNVAAMPA